MAKKLYSPEETAKKFETLPQEIKDLLYSFEMTSIITKIGEKNGLHIDQMELLNTETAQVMMGLIDTKDFIEVLMEELSVDQVKAGAIASDVNEMLFSKIRAAMNQPSAAASMASSGVRQPLADVLPKASIVPIVALAGDMKPSSTSAPTPPLATASTPASGQAAPVTVLPSVLKIDTHPADVMLTEKTVATPATPAPAPVAQKPADTKATPPKPTDYKADPYREPIN